MSSESIQPPGMHMRMLMTQDQLLEARQHPFQFMQHIELLQHLGPEAEKFHVATRDLMISLLPGPFTIVALFWGPTGAGKRTAAGEYLSANEQDPILLEALAKHNVPLRKVYLPFSSSATLAELRGLTHPSHGHGQYDKPEYRSASKIHTAYLAAEFNNYEGPTLVAAEPSGLTARRRADGTLYGTDRAYSSADYLSKHHSENTKILVVKRDAEVVQRILQTRTAILAITDEDIKQLVGVLRDAHLQIMGNKGKLLELEKLKPPALRRLRNRLIEGFAPGPGVIRSNMEMKKMMLEEFGIDDEDEFWPVSLNTMGFPPENCYFTTNYVSDEDFTFYDGLLTEYDPMQNEINKLRGKHRKAT